MRAAIIVAGGHSSRMSATAPRLTPPKPLLQRIDAPGQPRLIDLALNAARDAVGPNGMVVVVGPPVDVVADPAARVVREDPPFAGPAAAIAAGLREIRDHAESTLSEVLILAADLVDPVAGVAALCQAVRRDPDAQAWVAYADGVMQPLLSVIRADAAQRVFFGVVSGSVRAVLAQLNVVEVHVPRETTADVDDWGQANAHHIGSPSGAVSWVSARDRIASAARQLCADKADQAEYAVPVPGRVLARDVIAPMDVPHYNSSAMDGFAVAGPPPWRLLADVPQGNQHRNIHREAQPLSAGQALPVLTGSVLPQGTSAIVRSERCRIADGMVHPTEGGTATQGADIRRAGEELRRGEVLLAAGTRLGPRDVALLGACAVDSVWMTPGVSVDLAITGNEVISSGIPSPGEVRDAFSSSLPTLIADAGGSVGSCVRLCDDPRVVTDWLEQASADIVVLTGGSGRSGQDFARRAISELSDVILADSVRCAPGHPTLLAARTRQYSDSPRTQLIIGAPGNPLAAHVAFHSFVDPAIRIASGAHFPAAGICRVGGAGVAPTDRQRVRLLPARVDPATGVAQVLPQSRSHMLSGYAAADVLLVVGPAGAQARTPVLCLPLP